MRFMWLWLFIALLIAGCASRYLVRPQIALVDLRPGEVTLLETGLNAIVRIDNEGRNPLRINGAVFRLYLNDIDIGRGMTAESVSVPGLGSANQEVLFRLNNISLISRIQSLLEADQFTYKISGHVYIGGFGPDRRIPVEHTGSLNLK